MAELYQIFVHVACHHGSVFLWQHCDTLCTSGFTDDIIFSYHGTNRQNQAWCCVGLLSVGPVDCMSQTAALHQLDSTLPMHCYRDQPVTCDWLYNWATRFQPTSSHMVCAESFSHWSGSPCHKLCKWGLASFDVWTWNGTDSCYI